MSPMTLRLSPTPVTSDGPPLPATPAWLSQVEPSEARQWYDSLAHTPLTGETKEVDGVAMVEVSFLDWVDGDDEVMVHLNGFTDSHRTDVTPALLEPVGGSSLRHRSYLLPSDGCYSYRLVRMPTIPRDAGQSRPGWMKIHQAGVLDPRNPRTLPRAGYPGSSLWWGPTSPHHWDHGVQESTSWHESTVAGDPDRWVAWLARPGATRTVVLLDGEQWALLRPDLLANCRDANLLLISSVDMAVRSRDLPHPERIARVLSDVLDHVRAEDPSLSASLAADRLVVAGQSYGGLAAAALAVTRPDLVRSAVAQSGSFWFRADEEPASRSELRDPGDLTQWLRRRSTNRSSRIVVQVGTEEGDMVEQARWFTEAARGTGHRVRHREHRGGHDYAWWFPALDDGLAALDQL